MADPAPDTPAPDASAPDGSDPRSPAPDASDGESPVVPRRPWRAVLKWAWIVAVVGVTGSLLASRWAEISTQLREMSPVLVAVGVLFTLAAKLVLGENARLAAVTHGIPLDRESAVRLYNLSQLGKYLPGSVWQFISRAAAYRDRGAPAGRIRDAILTESLWVLGGALAYGTLVSGFTVLPVVAASIDRLTLVWIGVGVAAGAVLLTALAVRRGPQLRGYVVRSRPTPYAVAVQAVVWTLLGLAFFALARAGGIDVPVLYAVGLFATAYAVGFVVLFVPAGLGVRDGILTLGLLPYASAEEGLVVVLVARLVYVAVELLLVLVQEVLPRRHAEQRLG